MGDRLLSKKAEMQDIPMESKKALTTFYPEVAVGGYTRVDGTVQFYLRINALLKNDMTILDLGAGRGEAFEEHPDDWKTQLMNFKGRCQKVIGADVDPAILSNKSLDQAFVIGVDNRLPLSDASVDLIVSDHTFEHVDNPSPFCAEILRVLRPGGWLCARTPNKWGYISIGARLVPNSLHTKTLRFLQPHRKAIDVFPTRYRLNTFGELRKHFSEGSWQTYIFTWNAEPAYFSQSVVAWFLMLALFRILPSRLGSTFMFYARKRAS